MSDNMSAKLKAIMTLLSEAKSWKHDALKSKMPKGEEAPDADEEGAEGALAGLDDEQGEATGESGGPLDEILKKMKAYRG